MPGLFGTVMCETNSSTYYNDDETQSKKWGVGLNNVRNTEDNFIWFISGDYLNNKKFSIELQLLY